MHMGDWIYERKTQDVGPQVLAFVASTPPTLLTQQLQFQWQLQSQKKNETPQLAC
jgi:hypothetical protein